MEERIASYVKTSALLAAASDDESVALTDLELEHPGSTANLYDLPESFHYGIGSPGLGAWRELAAHELTTNWVLEGRSASFPLLYHSRVLRGAPPARPDEGTGPEFWGNSAPVRARFAGLASATKRVVLFLEYIPRTLHDWLDERRVRGDLETCGATPRCHSCSASFTAG